MITSQPESARCNLMRSIQCVSYICSIVSRKAINHEVLKFTHTLHLSGNKWLFMVSFASCLGVIKNEPFCLTWKTTPPSRRVFQVASKIRLIAAECWHTLLRATTCESALAIYSWHISPGFQDWSLYHGGSFIVSGSVYVLLFWLLQHTSSKSVKMSSKHW